MDLKICGIFFIIYEFAEFKNFNILEALQKKTNFDVTYNKVKTGSIHVVKKYRKSGGTVPLFLKLGTKRRRVVILTPPPGAL